MDNEYEKISIKEIFSSFKCWPQVFKFIKSIDNKYLVIIFFLSIVQGFLPSITIVATQNLINEIQFKMTQKQKGLVATFLFFIGINFLASIIGQVKGYLESVFRLKLSYKTSVIVLEKATTLELEHFENSDIYDMIRRAQGENGDRLYEVFSKMLELLSQIITLVSTAALLIMWKWWIVIIILIVPILSSIYSIKIGNLQYKIQKERAQDSRKSWYLTYLLTNDISFKEIKLYSLSSYFLDKFKFINEIFIKQDKNILNKRTKMNFIFEVLDQVIGAFVMFLIIRAGYVGEILIGNVIAYIRCISNVQSNTSALLWSLVSLYQNNLYINMFFEFINLEVKHKKICEGRKIEKIENIELVNVSYKYEKRSSYAIKNINLKLDKDSKIALVGHNGSGKTTLIKIICGFYDNYEGDILINGINLKELDLESYRRKMGIVFQDYSRYELSLRENIASGDIEKINEDLKIVNAIENSDGSDILENVSEGLDSQLGVWFDDGVQLSGGQWQKLALSRAFFRDSDIYILDEPSSALDPISEYNMLCKCCELIKDKMGIFITHRLFSIKRMAAEIVVLKNGEIVENGTHEKLMNEDGYYAYLYNMQNLDESISNL